MSCSQGRNAQWSSQILTLLTTSRADAEAFRRGGLVSAGAMLITESPPSLPCRPPPVSPTETPAGQDARGQGGRCSASIHLVLRSCPAVALRAALAPFQSNRCANAGGEASLPCALHRVLAVTRCSGGSSGTCDFCNRPMQNPKSGEDCRCSVASVVYYANALCINSASCSAVEHFAALGPRILRTNCAKDGPRTKALTGSSGPPRLLFRP